MRYLVDGSLEERFIGMKVCVVKGWRSRILTLKIGELCGAEMASDRGKQENIFITAVPGLLLGAWEYLFIILVRSANLSAVFWFASTPLELEIGRVESGECDIGGRGLSITVPKRENED